MYCISAEIESVSEDTNNRGMDNALGVNSEVLMLHFD